MQQPHLQFLQAASIHVLCSVLVLQLLQHQASPYRYHQHHHTSTKRVWETCWALFQHLYLTACCLQVVQLLRQKSTSKNGMSQADAGEQLELMLRLVPEFLRVVTSSGASLAGITQSVRINRQISWPAARQKLLAGAAEARSSGRAAAAHAVAAEQQREADMAAVAAAAAIELDDGEVSGSELEDEEDYEEQEELLVCDAGPEPAAAAAAAGVDELGLDILAELDGNAGTGSSSSTAAGGLDDEALMLLGGGCSKAGAKPAVSGAVLSALAFKAPARKAARK